MKKERAEAVDLDGALAVKAEMDRLGAHQPTSEEQRKAMPPALRALRGSYDAALKGYWDEAARGDGALLQKYLADLEVLQKRITITGNLEKALLVKVERERAAADAAKGRPAISPPAPVAPITPVTPSPVPEPVKIQPVMIQPAAPQPFLKFGNAPIAKATRERPFENTLGMKFVPVPDTEVLFCIWETRVKDYAPYARGKKVDRAWETQQKGEIPAGQAPDHPVCRVNWEDGKGFCEWLTKKETADEKLPKGAIYRLPTDEEWSRAMGLPKETGDTPRQRHRKVKGYPWGDEWPPKGKVGNYRDSAYHEKFPKNEWIEGYTDGFATTAPVGSFPANPYGIFDLGGNVWEVCEDLIEPGSRERTRRGGSWATDPGPSRGGVLVSSWRHYAAPGHDRGSDTGFRCVIAVSAP